MSASVAMAPCAQAATSTVASQAQPVPRSRTTSLLSSMSHTIFGLRTRAKPRGSPADAENVSMASSNKAPSGSKSILARRLSQGSSKRPRKISKTEGALKDLNGSPGMAPYLERRGTFARSSPELGEAEEHIYQNWPRIEDDRDQSKGSDYIRGEQSIPLVTKKTTPLTPRSARATYESPALPRLRTISSPIHSPSFDPDLEVRRAASRAEALAKLTESATSTHLKFPTTPPRPPHESINGYTPTHSSPARLFSDFPSAGRRYTSEQSPQARPIRPTFRPILETHSSGSSGSIPGVRPKRVPSHRRRSSGAKSMAGITCDELQTPGGLQRGLVRARDFVQRELGGSWLAGGDEPAALLSRLRDGTNLCRRVHGTREFDS